jgi:hypothetical protein
VSRSQTGWSTTDSHDHDDFGSQSDHSDAGAESPPRGGPRPSADADLVTESMSFEQEDSPPRKTGRAMPVPEVRRSNNQEEEDRSEGSDDASVEEDFEAEASEGSDAEFDFGDTGYAPTSRAAAPRASTQPPAQARNAFASPEQPKRTVQDESRDDSDHHAQSEHSDQEEDEYGDDGFDEADEDQASGSEEGDRRRVPAVSASAAAAPARQSLFAPSAAAPVRGRQPAQEESRDEESVEESIPEEDDEGDGMSVGQVNIFVSVVRGLLTFVAVRCVLVRHLCVITGPRGVDIVVTVVISRCRILTRRVAMETSSTLLPVAVAPSPPPRLSRAAYPARGARGRCRGWSPSPQRAGARTTTPC